MGGLQAHTRAPGRVRRRALLAWLGAFLIALLGATPQADEFAPVIEGQRLEFPRDLGAHPDYRTEWWYITGWLTDTAGESRGFQITFFRVGTGIGADNPSRFAPRQLILAHAALADPRTGRLRHVERVARAVEPLAGAATGRTQAWIDDWMLILEDDPEVEGGERYLSRIEADDLALDLTLIPRGLPLLNGHAGFSQKTPNPLNASYYYSRPQLQVTGQIRVDGRELGVKGQAWLDHEWSSEILPEEAQGWDWIGINLRDGGSLMAFRMRRTDGAALWTAATLREGQAEPRILPPEQVRFIPGRRWQSPRTGAEYPVEWTLEIADRRLRLSPLMDDQELDGRRSTGVVYWEGAVSLHEDDTEIGRGYLEMTGYWQRPSGL